jgi:plasmid stabilization system protein ParE
MRFRVRYTEAARADLQRLYSALLEYDLDVAERALEAIEQALPLLQQFPFSCRKAEADNPFLRELIVSFGSSGYVLLFEIADADVITILAIRHQREDDFH